MDWPHGLPTWQGCHPRLAYCQGRESATLSESSAAGPPGHGSPGNGPPDRRATDRRTAGPRAAGPPAGPPGHGPPDCRATGRRTAGPRAAGPQGRTVESESVPWCLVTVMTVRTLTRTLTAGVTLSQSLGSRYPAGPPDGRVIHWQIPSVSSLWGAADVHNRLVTVLVAIRVVMLLQVTCTASPVGK